MKTCSLSPQKRAYVEPSSGPPSGQPGSPDRATPPLYLARFLHPLHNFSLVSYDPRELPAEARRAIRPAQLSPATPLLQRGESVTLACITKELRVMQRKSNVTNATCSLSIHEAEVPRWGARGVGGQMEEPATVTWLGLLARNNCIPKNRGGLYTKCPSPHFDDPLKMNWTETTFTATITSRPTTPQPPQPPHHAYPGSARSTRRSSSSTRTLVPPSAVS
jgi:hypothetical protein